MYKILFKVGSFEIYSYSILTMLAVIIAIWIAIVGAKRKDYISQISGNFGEIIWDLALYVVILGAIGARLLYVIVKWTEYAQTPIEIFNFRGGGLSLHGALLGGVAGIIWFARRHKMSSLILMDIISPGAALGIAIGRIGCFLNGCCLGKITELPWGVIFSETRYPGKRHPTQIYEFLLDIVLFVILFCLQSNKFIQVNKSMLTKPGALTLVFFGGYSLIRFIVEFWREDPIFLAEFTLAQWTSIVTVISAFIIWQRYYKPQKQESKIIGDQAAK